MSARVAARLKDALDRDYEVLTYLLKNAANAPAGEAAIEKRMLEIYFRLASGIVPRAASRRPQHAEHLAIEGLVTRSQSGIQPVSAKSTSTAGKTELFQQQLEARLLAK
jgi:hypothetical protein